MAALVVGCSGAELTAQARDYPILDMHLHAMRANSYGPPGTIMCADVEAYLGWDPQTPLNPGNLVECARRLEGARTDDELMRRTLAILDRENIIGVTSGPRLGAWMDAAPGRIIPGILTSFGVVTPDSVRALLESGAIRVLAEVTTQYRGIAPNAEELDPYWELAQEYDVPVGIHMGSGPPGQPMMNRAYRAALGNPLLLEDVLGRFPRMRVYVMHSGYPYVDDLISLMLLYPQVYAEIGVIGWVLPRQEFHRFLERLMVAGLGQRIMFGSDQMVWPDAIEVTIDAIETAPFLTASHKRGIFYENARAFLRLEP